MAAKSGNLKQSYHSNDTYGQSPMPVAWRMAACDQTKHYLTTQVIFSLIVCTLLRVDEEIQLRTAIPILGYLWLPLSYLQLSAIDGEMYRAILGRIRHCRPWRKLSSALHWSALHCLC